MLKSVSKEVHGLVLSDIVPEDRQNYGSLEKLMDDRVINALKKYVADCDGTIMYLKLCKLITSSFTATNLSSTERIYNIWFSLYFIRCWRKWLKSKGDYSLDENFISENVYTCLEINAHNLIKLVQKLRSSSQENLFLPQLFASQPCEHIFRMMRSMGTQQYTKINFTLSELFHLVTRVELSQKISYSNDAIEFPRVSKGVLSDHVEKLPSDLEIKQVLETAQKDALEKAACFGILFNANDIQSSEMSQRNDSEDDGTRDSDYELVEEDTSDISPSPFLDIIDPDGNARQIRKSTFIWIHTEEKDKLSSDRLKRVQGSSTKRRKIGPSGTSTQSTAYVDSPGDSNSNPNFKKSDEIMIGDWTMFSFKNGKTASEQRDEVVEHNDFLIGLIIGFRCIDEKNRSKQYKVDFVSMKDQGPNKILALGIWYSYNENGLLKQISRNISVEMKSYICTMKPPIIKAESGKVNYILPFQNSEFENIHNLIHDVPSSSSHH